MKISKDLRSLTTTQVEMARALGITQTRVNQLIQDGIVVKNPHGAVLVIESLKNYYMTKAGGSAAEGVDYMEEKAKHEAAKRKIAEIELKKLKNEVFAADDVEMVMTDMLNNLRSQLRGIPAKMAPILAGQDRTYIASRLAEEIETRLSELSDYNPQLFSSEREEEREEE